MDTCSRFECRTGTPPRAPRPDARLNHASCQHVQPDICPEAHSASPARPANHGAVAQALADSCQRSSRPGKTSLMSTELRWLLFTALLAGSLWIPYIIGV